MARRYHWLKATVTGNTSGNFTEIDGSTIPGGGVNGIAVGAFYDYISGGATAADFMIKDGNVTSFSILAKTGLTTSDVSYGATDLDGKPVTGIPTLTGANVSGGTTVVTVYLCVAEN